MAICKLNISEFKHLIKKQNKKKIHVFYLTSAMEFSDIFVRSNQLEFQRFLTLVRDFYILSLLDRWQSSCLRR